MVRRSRSQKIRLFCSLEMIVLSTWVDERKLTVTKLGWKNETKVHLSKEAISGYVIEGLAVRLLA